jgi:transposase-like protein
MAKATPARATATNAASASSGGTGRSYRRAPQDLAQVLSQAGGVTAVADHYGVPRHTAQSWVRTLRRKGGAS